MAKIKIQHIESTPGSNCEINSNEITVQVPGKMPAAVVDEYVRNMQLFEKAYANAKQISIADRIGNPIFLSFESLNTSALKAEIIRFKKLLNEHAIELHFCQQPYPDELIYRFMTEEFLEKQIDDVRVPGMNTCFIYEEFHPNHESDITLQVKEFFQGWFDGEFSDQSFLFDHTIRVEEGVFITKRELFNKLENFFSSFKRFENCDHSITNKTWQLNDEQGDDQESAEGTGLVEGLITFDGIIDHCEGIHFKGNYRLNFVRKYGCWMIDHFTIPGFNTTTEQWAE